jgi:hypothetical protein
LMFLTFFISCFSEARLFSRDFTVERSSRISLQNFRCFPSAGQFSFVSFSLVSRLIMFFSWTTVWISSFLYFSLVSFVRSSVILLLPLFVLWLCWKLFLIYLRDQF